LLPSNIILEGVAGSQAYGLATPTSDEDIKGIFVAPTDEILGLDKPKDTYDHTAPDYCYYEVEKFMRLALKCNPTVLEMLWLADYSKLTMFGRMLVSNRHLFLSESGVREAFGGYAYSQIVRLKKRTNEGKDGFGRGLRYEKHVRHCFRLMREAKQLLETGTMDIRYHDPAERAELFELGLAPLEEVEARYAEAGFELDFIESVLPAKPDRDAVNTMLLTFRG
jgi:uncharacterized protein